MKWFYLILCFLLTAPFSQAKPKSQTAPTKKSERVTDANFSGSTVNGRYAHSPEATVSVEEEKKLISVVQPRKKFKFQLKQSQEDYK